MSEPDITPDTRPRCGGAPGYPSLFGALRDDFERCHGCTDCAPDSDARRPLIEYVHALTSGLPSDGGFIMNAHLNLQLDDFEATIRAEFAEALREARERGDELQALFDLQRARTVKAVALWRAESPEERALRLPDLGALIEWLMARAESAEAALASERTRRERAEAALKIIRGLRPSYSYGHNADGYTRDTLNRAVRTAAAALAANPAGDGALPPDAPMKEEEDARA